MPNRAQEFEDALGDLLLKFIDVSKEEMISAMEIRIMAMKEEE